MNNNNPESKIVSGLEGLSDEERSLFNQHYANLQVVGLAAVSAAQSSNTPICADGDLRCFSVSRYVDDVMVMEVANPDKTVPKSSVEKKDVAKNKGSK